MVIGVLRSADSQTHVDFRAFFEAEYERVLKTMLIVTGNRSEAEDIAQEAMARAFERWGSVSAAASPAGYVFTTAFNLHRSGLRRTAAL
jgi:RNA polymerase sigma-70 factor (ECF subfamily)